MKNNIIEEKESRIGFIFDKIKGLPYFAIDDLASVETNKIYLRILLARYCKAGKLIRLKKGYYVADEYLKNLVSQNGYAQFVANLLCPPSYLSLDYVLNRCGILTEMPVNFISVAKEKTISFSNRMGNFFYHKIRPDLFCGFETIEEGGFAINRATKAKAVFDYLYFKKKHLICRESAEELRLNVFLLGAKDRKELRGYIDMEKSRKMKEIYDWILA